jgi:hypothetical protein
MGGLRLASIERQAVRILAELFEANTREITSLRDTLASKGLELSEAECETLARVLESHQVIYRRKPESASQPFGMIDICPSVLGGS